MNDTNTLILKNMNKTEFVTFLKEALGIYHFLDNQGMKLQGTKIRKDKSSGLKKIAELYDSQGKNENVYYVNDKKNDNMIFIDNNGEHNISEFFDNIFDDSILFCLLIASKKQKTPFVYDAIIQDIKGLSDEMMRQMLGREIETYGLFEKKQLTKYNFVLGAGINYGLGPKNWSQLIDDMYNSIKNTTGLSDENLSDFKDKVCNTTYVIPQILKDLDENEYFNILSESIYSKFTPSNVNVNQNPAFVNTTIYQIARILSGNIRYNRVLTFNYDEILELVLEINFDIKAGSVYKGHAKTGSLPIINHTHGFWPYCKGKRTKKHKKSIVLSSIEYMENYQTLKDYSASKLYEFIDDVCILIGNSLSDYEEQKVFKNHHKKNISQFSFLFMCENNSWRRKYYMIYFMQLGVIPIFFNSFNDMVEIMKQI